MKTQFGVTGQLSSANNYAAIIERMIAKIGQETDRKKILAAAGNLQGLSCADEISGGTQVIYGGKLAL